MEISNTQDAQAVATSVTADAQNTLEFVQEATIKNNAEMEFAVSALAEVKTAHKEVDAKRKEFVQPLNAVVKNINAFFKPALTSLKKSETVLKGKVLTFKREQQAERDKLIEEHKVAEAAECIVPEVVGVSVRTKTVAKVVDMGAAVRWCLGNGRLDLVSVDAAKLLELGAFGVEAEEIESLAITASKVKR